MKMRKIIRKIKKRFYLRSADNIRIKHVDEVVINPVLKCNLNCVMCHQGEIKCQKDMDLDSFVRILKNLKKEGVTKVSLVGGEIFVLKDIWKFIGVLEKMRFKYDLSTNLVNVPGLNRFKLLKGLEMVTTSIDGDLETHNKIRRNPEAFQKTMENIKKLIKDKIKVDVACVVQNANFEILEKITIMLCKKGVKNLSFLVVNEITEKEKEKSIEKVKRITGKKSELFISAKKNPLGKLEEKHYKNLSRKVNNIKKIAKRFGAKASFTSQMEDPKLLYKDTSLKDYTCGLFNGYNSYIYSDGEMNTCAFTKIHGDHNVKSKGPLKVLNSEDYIKIRQHFQKNGATDKCRRCCALVKKCKK